ncbi:MAG: hypothetical protein QXK06_02460 [Candidatus Diapherotrites archaeon]
MEGLKKGFIFSMDALGAIAIVLVVGAIWVLFLHHANSTWPVLSAKEAKDRAIVAVYRNQSFNETTSAPAANADMNTIFCKKYYLYSAIDNKVSEKSVCKGVKQ